MRLRRAFEKPKPWCGRDGSERAETALDCPTALCMQYAVRAGERWPALRLALGGVVLEETEVVCRVGNVVLDLEHGGGQCVG
jgi:hypothetical protein